MAEIKIKKGTVNIKSERSDLIEASETADGMAFSFKGGFQLYITDAYMPAAFKQQIAMSINRFEGATVSVDFDNVRKPVLVEL
jgi:hypothetical protein